MSEATVRASLKTILESISDMGTVHDYQRWSSTFDAFLSHFKATIGGVEVIRGWVITATAIPQEGFVTTGNRHTSNRRTYIYQIRGYWGLDDSEATEKSALAKTIEVMDALDSGSIFTGNVISAGLSQLNTFEPRVFGSSLCHYSEIEQQITEKT